MWASLAVAIFFSTTLATSSAEAKKYSCLKSNVSSITSLLNTGENCGEKASKKFSCQQLSDDFCERLWGEEALGNVSFSNEDHILTGKTRSQMITHREYLDWQALFLARCRLPKDFQKALKIDCDKEAEDDKSILNDLMTHIQSEKLFENIQDETLRLRWRRTLGDYERAIGNAIRDVADERTFSRFPDFRKLAWKDLKDIQRREFYRDHYDLKNEILDAKYKKHPNWKRVERLFSQAKKDVIRALDQLTLPKKIKRKMEKKLKSVKLSLPYEDPRILGSTDKCGTHEENAYYTANFNTFTVCAGYFNAYQVDGHLYRAISHEISHSIDPQRLALDTYEESRYANFLRKLYKTGGQINCKEWRSKTKKIWTLPTSIFKLPASIEKLSSCLVDRSRLEKLEVAKLKSPTRAFTSRRLDGYASPHWFVKLAQPKMIHEGQEIENQYYLDSKLLAAASNKYFEEDYYEKRGYLHIGSLFVQNLRCEAEEKGLKLEAKKPVEIPAEIFEKALADTQGLYSYYQARVFSYAGKNSEYLQYYDLARPAGEAWSDWLAVRAMKYFLERVKTKEEKRLFALSTQAVFCRSDSLDILAKEKTKAERVYSKAVHPLSRIRRLRFFSPIIAEQAGCKMDEEVAKLTKECKM